MKYRIILASQSPRRQDLLQRVGIAHEVYIPNTDETYPAHLPLEQVPAYIATEKAQAVAQQLSAQHNSLPALIIAADTIVCLYGQVIGKPTNRSHAIDTLRQLSGQQHSVITGVCIQTPQHLHTFTELTTVRFHALTDQQISHYVDTCQPYDKAGSYAIQEWIGLIGIARIEGCYFNVMGLPISVLVQHLKQLNEI